MSQYRNHVYDSTDDPEELKSHLVFNEAQYYEGVRVRFAGRLCASTTTT